MSYRYDDSIPVPAVEDRREQPTFLSVMLQLKPGFSVWLPCATSTAAWLILRMVQHGKTREQYIARREEQDGVKGMRIWRRTKEQTEAYIAERGED